MSINPEVDGIVVLPVPDEPVAAGNGHVDEQTAVEFAPAVAIAPAVEPVAQARRGRPAWVVPAAIAAVGLIVSGALGYVLYTTIQQRDGLHKQLVSTQGTLASTQDQLTSAQADAKSKKATADYVALYVADEGKILMDYENFVACSGYSNCRTVAQQFLTDMQTFQADRKTANVPFALESTDASLGDALSAAIAGDQEMISGMDTNDIPKLDDGGSKVDSAMLNLAKAEAAMGTQLR